MNHFDRFGLKPALWIDPETLKEKFLELSAEAHPDKLQIGNKAEAEHSFRELNEAYNTLRNTRSRLLHILEISGQPKQEHVQNVPPVVLELFSVIAEATKRADRLVEEKKAANSPMLKVQLMDRVLSEIDSLQDLQSRLRAITTSIETELQNQTNLEVSSEADLKTARESSTALGFLERWNTQLQDRVAALTFQ